MTRKMNQAVSTENTARDAIFTATNGGEVRIADDFTREEIAKQLDATMSDLVRTEARWPGLVALVGTERTGHLGKLIALLDTPLRGLFEVLTPVAGEAPGKTAS